MSASLQRRWLQFLPQHRRLDSMVEQLPASVQTALYAEQPITELAEPTEAVETNLWLESDWTRGTQQGLRVFIHFQQQKPKQNRNWLWLITSGQHRKQPLLPARIQIRRRLEHQIYIVLTETSIRAIVQCISIRTGIVMTVNNLEQPVQQRLSGVPVQIS